MEFFSLQTKGQFSKYGCMNLSNQSGGSLVVPIKWVKGLRSNVYLYARRISFYIIEANQRHMFRFGVWSCFSKFKN